MKITVNYKSGATVRKEAYNVWMKKGCLYFTIKSNPSALVVKPTKVPLDVINTYVVEDANGSGCWCSAGTKCGDAEECYSGRCAR